MTTTISVVLCYRSVVVISVCPLFVCAINLVLVD